MTERQRENAIICGVALIAVAAIVALFSIGCADKETIRTIQSILPDTKPPIECPKHLCRKGQECVKCEDE